MKHIKKYISYYLLSVVVFVSILSFLYGLFVGIYKVFPYSKVQQIKRFLSEQHFSESDKAEKFDAARICVESRNDNKNTSLNTDSQGYQFYVAGHAYGSPETLDTGIYKKFYSNISEKAKNNEVDFGFLTGDIVREPSKMSWNVVKEQMSALQINTYMAPGNHDVGNGPHNAKRDLYEILYGQTYLSFYRDNDLFIILDPNISGHDIDGDQLRFLKNILRSNAGKNNNVFVLMHQIIWSDNANVVEFSQIIPNSKEGKNSGVTNYWAAVAPLLEQQKNEVYVISGDVGAFDNGSELFCNTVKNIKYIASGMGGGVRDNYLLISVTEGIVKMAVVKL